MLILNILRILFIFQRIKHGSTQQTSAVNFNDYYYKQRITDCYQPEANDLTYHSCLKNITYPTNRTTCRCSSNYDQFINLVCIDGWSSTYWYREGNKKVCTDELNPVETYVYLWDTHTQPFIGTCYKPSEQLLYFHSCYKYGYPKSTTECYCSKNYPKKVTLNCLVNVWYGNWHSSCRGDNKDPTTIVRLDEYDTDSYKSCKRPEEQLNIFHNCENKNYPTSETTCNCTANIPTKIDLICNYGTWRIKGSKMPCKFTLLPNEVYCIKENNTEVACRCLSNFKEIDMQQPITQQQIHETCSSKGKTSAVNLNQFRTELIGECYKPDASDFFYYCTHHEIQERNITCTCTLNYPFKIQLVCYNNIWYRATQDNVCDNEYVDPNAVHCENTTEGDHCRCKSNCFDINLSGRLTYRQITALCAQTFYTQLYKEKNMISYFDNSTRKVVFTCDGEVLDDNGKNYMMCNNGTLTNGSIPTCSIKTNDGYKNSDEIHCNIMMGEKICRCKKNCFQLNMQEILNNKQNASLICSQTGLIQHFTDKNLISFYDGLYQKLKFSCDSDAYEIVGSKELTCSNGATTGGNIPTCSLITKHGFRSSNEVHCDNKRSGIVCRCKKNCFELNGFEILSSHQIMLLCSQNSFSQHFKGKNLISFFDNKSNKIKYSCDSDEYDLNGANELACNNGVLSGGTIPTCSLITNGYKNSTEIFCERNPQETVCRCKKNCFELNAYDKLSNKQILSLCLQTSFSQQMKKRNLLSYYENGSNKVKFVCDSDSYEINGNNELTCNNGVFIEGKLPTCLPRQKSKTEEIKELNNQLGLHKISLYTLLSIVLVLCLLSGLIVAFLRYRQKKNLDKFLQEDVNVGTTQETVQNNPDNDEVIYDEIDPNALSQSPAVYMNIPQTSVKFSKNIKGKSTQGQNETEEAVYEDIDLNKLK